jgi:hypothetical protein
MTNASDVLQQFLSDPEKKTLLFKGKWGVGKTYAWKTFIEKKRMPEVAVSYVSLFGVGSVHELWQQILTNAVPKNATELRKLGKFVAPVLGILRQVPYAKAALGGAESLPPLLVRRFLICFDDFERKAPQLPLASLLGLVSVLKEEHDCRVVMILNEDQLTEDDRRSLKTYREKVIDSEFEYAPSANDNIGLVFKGQELPVVQETLELIDTNNIRVIKYCQWNARHFEPLLTSTEPELHEGFLRKLTLLTCLFHSHANEVDFSRIQDNFISRLLDKKEGPPTEAENLIRRVQYFNSDYDRFIIDYLHKGHYDAAEFKKTLESLNERELAKKTEHKLHDVWNKFHQNFQASATEVVAGFKSFVETNLADLKLGEMIQICDFVRQLGFAEIAAEWMDGYIQAHVPTAGLDAIELFKQQTNNQKILGLLSSKAQTLQEQISLKSVVYKVVAQAGWSPKDELVLNSFSEDDYYAWLKKETDSALINTLRNFNKMFNSVHTAETSRLIGRKLEMAILRLAREDPLNRLRAQNFFGISEPPPQADQTAK